MDFGSAVESSDELASAAVSRPIAERLASDLRAAAQRAASEEDLRVSAEASLKEALLRLGIPSDPSYERTYANHGGRSDAVYGRVVIEYEAVGALSRKGGVDHAAEQLERYLRAEVEDSRDFDALRRVVGVGLDGHKIFFLRFRGAVSFDEPGLYVAPGQGVLPLEGDPAFQGGLSPVRDGPYDVTVESVQTFLLYLRAASRSRLTPEGLAVQFGPSGPCASRAIVTLARLLDENGDDNYVSTFFNEWDRIFGIIYGIDLDRANRHLPILQGAYGLDARFSLKTALFAVHTYYALLMKLLAAELVSMQRESLIESFLAELPSANESKLLGELKRLESGDLFAHFSVQNFLEADFFGWYQTAWCQDLSDVIRDMIRILVTFEPASGVLDPRPTQDLLKRLYQYLVPKEIRHDLGEYYTPNWLADLVIEQSGYDGEANKRVLDPACGSGTFLVNAINRIRSSPRNASLQPAETAHSIISNVAGFELNPLAVIAARTNYLLALGPLLRELAAVEIPIYLCDSVLAPTATDVGLLGEEYELRTSVGPFFVPAEVVDGGHLSAVTGLLDKCLALSYTPAEFVELALNEVDGLPESCADSLSSLYTKLVKLRDEGRDGVWARIIRNAFAPLTCDLFDYVLGNPPWVNWQSLSPDYRAATTQGWSKYGLFSLKGHAARLGGGKKDLSALMLYRSADAYLVGGGTLAFLLTQTLFKSKGAGDGFRRFRLGSQAYLRVEAVHDLTKYQPFEGATTQTAMIVLRKGSPTAYPVKYMRWNKSGRVRGIFTASLGEVRAASTVVEEAASPIDPGKSSSPWMTASVAVDGAVRGVLGKSGYKGFAGVCTWANGIYWIDIREHAPNNLLRVRNRADEAKDGGVPEHDSLMEPTHLYPFCRSRDIRRWSAKPSSYMLVPQDPVERRGVAESTLRVSASRTYRFLKSFEGLLSERSGIKKYFDTAKGDPFYSVYNVQQGTFNPHKVMWRQMTPVITAAVVGPYSDEYLGSKPVVTQHVVSVVATETGQEAHYLCAMLNSSITTAISASYSTGKSYGTPSMLEYVGIPKFDADVQSHVDLAKLSQNAHAGEGDVAVIEMQVDSLASEVLGVPDGALRSIQGFVRTLRRQAPPMLIEDDAEGSDD